jgi:type II secretory pathway pseudopilin PulG
MLTIGILSILLLVALFVSMSAIARSTLRSTENSLIQIIRRAQTQAQQNTDGDHDGDGDVWGMQIDEANHQILSFYGDEGDDFSSKDGIDVTYAVNDNMAFGGTLYAKMLKEPPVSGKGFVFKRFTGDPVEATFSGSILMTLYGNTREITVSERGVVER